PGDLQLAHLCACLGEIEDSQPQRSTDGSRSLQEGSAIHVHGTPPALLIPRRSERSPSCNSLSRLRKALTREAKNHRADTRPVGRCGRTYPSAPPRPPEVRIRGECGVRQRNEVSGTSRGVRQRNEVSGTSREALPERAPGTLPALQAARPRT